MQIEAMEGSGRKSEESSRSQAVGSAIGPALRLLFELRHDRVACIVLIVAILHRSVLRAAGALLWEGQYGEGRTHLIGASR